MSDHFVTLCMKVIKEKWYLSLGKIPIFHVISWFQIFAPGNNMKLRILWSISNVFWNVAALKISKISEKIVSNEIYFNLNSNLWNVSLENVKDFGNTYYLTQLPHFLPEGHWFCTYAKFSEKHFLPPDTHTCVLKKVFRNLCVRTKWMIAR